VNSAARSGDNEAVVAIASAISRRVSTSRSRAF
jgi:hypothetical protein